ncbi:MAG TPA: YitT family protein [Bacilli bacterium]|nr:YitT family protein [Bacilli bacterium]
MKGIVNFFKKRDVSVVLGMLVGTLIYCLAVVWILDLGSFYAGGVTGISQIIETIVVRITGKPILGFKSFFIAILNVPLFLIGYKGVSKRFAILSVGSIAMQTIFIALLEYLKTEFGINPFVALVNDKLLLSVLGGLLTGLGCGIALRVGSSTGGMDIISQYVSFKKNISFAKFSLSVDLAIIIVSGFVGTVETAIYTIIRLIVGILVLDKVHTIYKYMKVSIITEEKDRMREELIARFNHGITIYSAVGGYTNKTKYVLETVVSSYEAEEYKNIAMQIDPHCFITYTGIKQIYGLFNRNAIT